MTINKIKFIIFGLVFSLIASIASAQAQGVTRGPYLQKASSTSMTVVWRTPLTDPATNTVHFGISADNLSLTAVSTTTTIACGSGCDALQHEAELSGLNPATKYFYAIGDSSGPLADPNAAGSFTTSPIVGNVQPTRVWVIGDSGTANANALAVRDAYKSFTGSRDTDLWLMLGDNAYNDGTEPEYQTAVFDIYPELLRNVPLWSTLGNHDGLSATSGSQTGPYYNIFSFPTAGEAGGVASGTEAYYSFDYGNIHFISLNSYDISRSTGGTMWTWLQNDLQATNQEWIIAFWHHPPYSKGSHNSDSESRLIQMRENMLPLLEANGVDLVLTGHSHTYERSFLLDGHYGDSSELIADPSLILDSGNGLSLPKAGGNGEYLKDYTSAIDNKGAVYAVAGSSGKVTTGTPLNHPAMFIALEELGSMVLDVYGDRMDVAFIGSDGAVHDQFTMAHGPDSFSPAIISSNVLDANTLEVLFTEPLDVASAEDINNYNVDGGITVNGASVDNESHKVTLTTSSLADAVTYTLTVTNVMDYLAGNGIINPGIQTQFSYSIELNQNLSFKNGVSPDASYAGTEDTYIRETSPTTNYGSETILLADGSDADPSTSVLGEVATLVKWDLSAIPADATIESASIVLDVFNPSSGLYNFFEVTTPWNETTANWSNSGNAGDRGTVIMGSLNASSTGQLSTSLNQSGIDLIQSWVDGSKGNNGFYLKTSGTNDGIDIVSSEGAVGGHPELQVSFTLPGNPGNQNPVLNFIADQTVDENQTLTVPVSASDPEGEVPVLTASNVPSFATFTDNGDGSGSLQANPGFSDSGAYVITITATDSGALADNQNFTLTVANVNRQPTMNPINNQSVNEGETLTVLFSSSDPDLEALALTVNGMPSFGTFTDNGDNTGNLDFAPGGGDEGDYVITVTATDPAGLSDGQSFTLTVVDVLAPTMHIENLSMSLINTPKKSGYASAIVLVHSDSGQMLDNVAVTGQWSGDFYPSPSAPATVNTGSDGTARFDSIEISRRVAGQLIFTVTDIVRGGFDHEPADDAATSGCVDTAGLICSSDPGNNPPSLDPVADQTVLAGGIKAVVLNSTDPDVGDTLTLTAPGLPGFVSLTDNGNGTGQLSINPLAGDIGDTSITVIVTDANGNTDSQSFLLSVVDSIELMDVESVAVTISGKGKNMRGSGTVSVVDSSGVPLANAVVSAEWQLQTSSGSIITLDSQATGTTDSTGSVLMSSPKYRGQSGDIFRLIINEVSLQGYGYNSSNPKPSGEAIVQ